MTPVRPAAVPRAVLFDAGNTLLRMDYGAIVAALAAAGIASDEAAVEDAELRARVRIDQHLAPGASTESVATHDRYVAYLLEGLGVTDPDAVAAMSRWRWSFNAPFGLWTRPDPAAPAALARARAAGLVVGAISNSNGTVARILDEAGLGGGLDFVLDSSVVGVEKPDPRIFQIALGRAGLRPEEAAYVGDLYSVDVLGARAAGLRAVLMDPGGCWPPRDCPTARTAREAVRLLLESRALG
jgi:HAD superfamily hydrolase (TIGR01509 family)